MIQAPSGQPSTVTVDEAKRLYAPAVDAFVELLTKQNLLAGVFKVESVGELTTAASIDVGIHYELLAARGGRVVSHSHLLMRHPEHGVKTVTTLLVEFVALAKN
jgi:hypothetical protein